MEEGTITGQQQNTNYNYDYMNEGIMKLRLGVNEYLKIIQLYLQGQVEQMTPQGDFVKVELAQYTEPLANPRGIFSVMGWARGLISTPTVQGNLQKFDDLDNIIADLRYDLNQDLMTNLYTYGIKDENYRGIVDKLMTITRLFLSRLVGNKEREGFNATVRTNETRDVVKEGRKKIPFI